MSRTALFNKTKLITVVVLAVVGGALAITGYEVQHHDEQRAKTQLTAAQAQLNQTDQISYQGQNGVDGLTLLKKHAKVQTKHYSFGDLVTSINGRAGNGPKYWTFYVNGKESQVGASGYVTKNSDTLKWKLQ